MRLYLFHLILLPNVLGVSTVRAECATMRVAPFSAANMDGIIRHWAGSFYQDMSSRVEKRGNSTEKIERIPRYRFQ